MSMHSTDTCWAYSLHSFLFFLKRTGSCLSSLHTPGPKGPAKKGQQPILEPNISMELKKRLLRSFLRGFVASHQVAGFKTQQPLFHPTDIKMGRHLLCWLNLLLWNRTFVFKKSLFSTICKKLENEGFKFYYRECDLWVLYISKTAQKAAETHLSIKGCSCRKL